ncbi:MAG TPA: hypothetical protein VMW17_07170 [Candidatus Binatia bacterium]|nr:hypothetical protein [Candidatus Binatia bacterium]
MTARFRFSYPSFRWIFALGNAVVWFVILFSLGGLVHDHFAEDTGLSREGALYFFTLTPFVSSILATQGAVVNLRAQYLIGRFTAPPIPGAAPPPPANVWLVSIRSGLPLAAMLVPITLMGGLFLPENLSDRATSVVMGGIGAAATLVLAVTVADREFRRFHYHLGGVRPRVTSTFHYLGRYIAAPWALINVALNAIFAWMLYHQGPGHTDVFVSIEELRHDLSTSALMICLFTALPVVPEVETDFAAGLTPTVVRNQSVRPLWQQLAAAACLAGGVWLIVTVAAQLTRSQGVPLAQTMAVKAVGGGFLAATAAVLSGRWTLSKRIQQAALQRAVPTIR